MMVSFSKKSATDFAHAVRKGQITTLQQVLQYWLDHYRAALPHQDRIRGGAILDDKHISVAVDYSDLEKLRAQAQDELHDLQRGDEHINEIHHEAAVHEYTGHVLEQLDDCRVEEDRKRALLAQLAEWTPRAPSVAHLFAAAETALRRDKSHLALVPPPALRADVWVAQRSAKLQATIDNLTRRINALRDLERNIVAMLYAVQEFLRDPESACAPIQDSENNAGAQ